MGGALEKLPEVLKTGDQIDECAQEIPSRNGPLLASLVCRGKTMIRFTLQDEPASFDTRCRSRGRSWLESHSRYDGRPHDYWSEFEPELRAAFRGLCAYCAMIVMKANADHFIPVAVLKTRGEDYRAYEWDNFRYGEGVLNQKKSDHIVLILLRWRTTGFI